MSHKDYLTKITILENEYAKPNGYYSLQFSNRESLYLVDFKDQDGTFGTELNGIFYPMKSLSFKEEGQDFNLKNISMTKTAEKLYKNNILRKTKGYLIIKSEEK